MTPACLVRRYDAANGSLSAVPVWTADAGASRPLDELLVPFCRPCLTRNEITPAHNRTSRARTTASTISTCRPAELSGLAVDTGWPGAYGGRYCCTGGLPGGPEGTEAAP